jgi:hypothetical protein
MTHIRRTVLAILTMALVLTIAPSAAPAQPLAPRGLGATSALAADTGWRILRAAKGGTVYGPDNVSITVPPNVMKRNGKVFVQEIFSGVYNIHIGPAWKGKVTVRLPMTGDMPVVGHKRNGRWVLEKAKPRDGMAVARVRSLSLFSAIIKCGSKLVLGQLPAAVYCFLKEGVHYLPEYLAKKVAGLFVEWDPCRPPSTKNFSLDAFEILLSSCRAGETTPVAPTQPVSAPAPAPAPPSSPAPQPPAPQPPAPQPPAGATIVVNTCNTYGNCDYWNPIWVHANPAVSSRIADVGRGTALTARCWAAGRTLTDGSNHTTEDDARQFTSALWYGVDWNGGRGYVPAVWTTKREDRLGLPAC